MQQQIKSISPLIPINVDEKFGQIVSMRELYDFLEVKTPFTMWAKRMFDYGFIDNVDYLLVSQKSETNNPKNPYTTETDYALTLDTAKEIAMLQRSDKGKQARQYFIACEKALKEKPTTPTLPIDYKTALRALLQEVEKNDNLQQTVLTLKPKANYTDTVLSSQSRIPITKIAKEMGYTAIAFNQKLHEMGIQYNKGGCWYLYAPLCKTYKNL